jgi:hypothetical protein
VDITDYLIIKTAGELKKDTQAIFMHDDKLSRYIHVFYSESIGGFYVYMLKEKCSDDIDIFMRFEQTNNKNTHMNSGGSGLLNKS